MRHRHRQCNRLLRPQDQYALPLLCSWPLRRCNDLCLFHGTALTKPVSRWANWPAVRPRGISLPLRLSLAACCWPASSTNSSPMPKTRMSSTASKRWGEHTPPHTSTVLKRMGIVTALAIAIHNSRRHCHLHLGPGIPTNRYCRSPGRSYPQHSRRRGRFGPHLLLYRQSQKAFWYSFASGLAEPLGALLAYLLLTPFLTPMLMECTFAVVAGIMIYISPRRTASGRPSVRPQPPRYLRTDRRHGHHGLQSHSACLTPTPL